MARRRPTPPPLMRPSGLADLRLSSALKRHVALAIEYCGGDLKWAAEELEVDRSTLWRWLRGWDTAQPKPRMGIPHGSRKARLMVVAGGTTR